MYSGIKKADVTAPNGAVFTFTYESFTDTYICYLGGEKAERAAALFDVVDLYDAISRSITTVRKYGGWGPDFVMFAPQLTVRNVEGLVTAQGGYITRSGEVVPF